MVIDEQLKTFLEGGVGLMVGTRDSEMAPEATRAWGALVLEGGDSIAVLVSRAASVGVLENLEANGCIAVCFGNPVDYRSVQIKGYCQSIADANDDDREWGERHLQAFTERLEKTGTPRHIVRNLWSSDLVKITFSVEQTFDQTPGPGAGRRLSKDDDDDKKKNGKNESDPGAR